MMLNKEDREDLARIRIADNPLAKSMERNTIERLLEWDDRMNGSSRRKIGKREDFLYGWRNFRNAVCDNIVDYWEHMILNLKAALKCQGLAIMHILHAVVPIRLTSHHQ